MGQRKIWKYSDCFKRQVIADLEAGRFGSIDAARVHYGIGGCFTIQAWLRRYGRNELLPKVVRVEKPGEVDRLRELKRRVEHLERALGQTQAENVLNQAYLKLACERLGVEVEAFKKKSAGRPSTPPSESRD
jgi:transposase